VCCEDRAYLCRSCDFAVHSANPAAGAHARWFLSSARVALEALQEAPTQPLGRAAAVKLAAAARAAAQQAHTQAPPARKAATSQQAPHAAGQGATGAALMQPQRSAGVLRVPSFASLDVSLGMSDLLAFDKVRAPFYGSFRCGGADASNRTRLRQ